MKKTLCIGLALLLALGGATAVFAANSTAPTIAAAASTPAATTSSAVTTTEAAATIIPDMSFTGTPINLSLDNAYKKMLADSPGAKMAELNKKSAEGVARGYGESVQSINQLQEEAKTNVAASWALDTSNKAMLNANSDYAAKQAPKNYEAEINKLKTDTLNNYYALKNCESQLEIAKENFSLKEKLLANTQLKFTLGTVSKNDVLKAEVLVNEAKDQTIAATNGLNTMKMKFNQFMGYDLMQNVNLTDMIKEIPLSDKSLKDSIQSALKSRNEMAEAAYNLQMSKFNFDTYKAYPPYSSSYIKAQMSVLSAETGYKNQPLEIESDVRTKYMEMNAKYSAVQTGMKSIENAKESVRLAQLQYDSGMATLTNVKDAQLLYYNAQLSYTKSLLEYNLAVNAYNLSSGTGTAVAAIK